jgi:hypothetical protein
MSVEGVSYVRDPIYVRNGPISRSIAGGSSAASPQAMRDVH